MKKGIVLMLVIITLGAATLLTYRTSIQAIRKRVIEERLARLPEMHLFDLDSNFFVFQKIVPKHPTIIIYFQTGCEHCQYEAREIRKNIGKLGNTDIIMVTDESIAKIKTFATEYYLKDIPKVRFYKIDPNKIFSTFGRLAAPTILIYGKEGHLTHKFEGETKIEAILNHL